MLQTLASVDMENLPVVIRFLLQSVTAADAQEVTHARVGHALVKIRWDGVLLEHAIAELLSYM